MTPREDLIRIRHMRDVVEKAMRFTAGRSRARLQDDELLRLAVTTLVGFTGEARGSSMPLVDERLHGFRHKLVPRLALVHVPASGC